jgi:RsiW-degrading membrane proteinase PrsW (M82 family)
MYLLAVALHTAWDSIGTITGYIILAVIALAALAYITQQLREQAPGRQRG